MRKIYTLLIIAMLVLLGGCASAPIPTKSEINAADYGSKPSFENAQELVKGYMANRLFDPYSATYNCIEPLRAWASASRIVHANLGGRVHYGYLLHCSINAKNRFGAYVGAQRYNFMIRTSPGRSEVFEIPYQLEIGIVP
ncbi:MAG: hypothetical protein WA049_07970 [Ferribacterium limneticum]